MRPPQDDARDVEWRVWFRTTARKPRLGSQGSETQIQCFVDAPGSPAVNGPSRPKGRPQQMSPRRPVSAGCGPGKRRRPTRGCVPARGAGGVAAVVAGARPHGFSAVFGRPLLGISSAVLVQTNGWHRAFQSCTATPFAAASSLSLGKVLRVVAHYLIWRSTPRRGAARLGGMNRGRCLVVWGPSPTVPPPGRERHGHRATPTQPCRTWLGVDAQSPRGLLPGL